MTKIGAALSSAQAQLAIISDAPDLDAHWLLLHALGRNEVSWLLVHGDEQLTEEQRSTFAELVTERATGRPLAYILGYWEFYGRRFIVNEDVLIPRPSTERLVDKALDALRTLARQNGGRPLNVADVGTGSGCIAVTLALELTSPPAPLLLKERGDRAEGVVGEVKIIATDISPTALAVARENARHHDVLDRIEFLESDMLESLQSEQIDLIVSNPPYVPSNEVLSFEPRLALDGGPDGQRFVRQLLGQDTPALLEATGGLVRAHRLGAKK